jgi:hypothetical protein
VQRENIDTAVVLGIRAKVVFRLVALGPRTE